VLDHVDPSHATVGEIFGRDHRGLDELLGEVERALGAGQPARAAVFFSRFREGLERHIVAEEDVLFPAFEELTGVAGGPTAVMRAEHAEIRDLLRKIAGCLEGSADFAVPLGNLTALLYAHNAKEERILYPMTDRAAEKAGKLEALLSRIAL
jgi:iron-sulfur cluster repair protein YtfE (RIC family)